MADRAYITALLCAPLALPMNILSFLPMITGFWLHSARLFVNSSLPSSRNVYSCSLFVLAYCIAFYNSRFSDTSSTISSRYVKKDHSALDVCLFHTFPWSGYTLPTFFSDLTVRFEYALISLYDFFRFITLQITMVIFQEFRCDFSAPSSFVDIKHDIFSAAPLFGTSRYRSASADCLFCHL